jgi:hypothetical protein
MDDDDSRNSQGATRTIYGFHSMMPRIFFPSRVASDSGQRTFGTAKELNDVTEVHSPSINGGSSGC